MAEVGVGTLAMLGGVLLVSMFQFQFYGTQILEDAGFDDIGFEIDCGFSIAGILGCGQDAVELVIESLKFVGSLFVLIFKVITFDAAPNMPLWLRGPLSLFMSVGVAYPMAVLLTNILQVG